jgi:DNA-directed RNA polymerase subunit RPC12/RpoP
MICPECKAKIPEYLEPFCVGGDEYEMFGYYKCPECGNEFEGGAGEETTHKGE